MYHFDHIRRFYWERCTSDLDRTMQDRLFAIYWRYMLRC